VTLLLICYFEALKISIPYREQADFESHTSTIMNGLRPKLLYRVALPDRQPIALPAGSPAGGGQAGTGR